MQALIISEIKRNANGASHATILARVAPATMLARKVFAQTMIDLQRRKIVEVVTCGHGDHSPRYVISAWHGDLAPCCG